MPPAGPEDPRLDRPMRLEVEMGPLTQNRNDVRIPGDTGTRFSMSDLIGEDGGTVGRITFDWEIDERHSVRAVYAPLEIDGTGTLPQAVDFAGETFAPGLPTLGTYQFSNYRVGYRYTFLNRNRWRLRFGGTLFVRDAKVALEQGATQASDSNVGVVPLANFAAEYQPTDRWTLLAELDGLASPQGRAFDFTLRGQYALTPYSSLGLGYRTIEGGADNDDVYSFAWLNSFVVTLGFRF